MSTKVFYLENCLSDYRIYAFLLRFLQQRTFDNFEKVIENILSSISPNSTYNV